MRGRTGILILAASLAVAGCNKEVGMLSNDGEFGNATMNNSLVQTGQLGYTQMLGQRFAREVPTTITFAFNSAQIDPAAQAVLNQQANWIRQFPEVRFRVYGHTDLVGSNAYNKALGLRRARAVVAYLATQGISPSRLEALVSYGETRPVIPVSQPEVRNRRTVTEVSGFVGRHPTVMNGKYAQVVFREYVNSAEPRHPSNTVIQTQTNPGG